MEARHKASFNSNRVTLVRDMIVDETFLSHFAADNLLLEAHIEKIKSPAVSGERVSEFIRHITKRGPRAMLTTIEALVQTGQGHLADLLDTQLAVQAKLKCPTDSGKPLNQVQESGSGGGGGGGGGGGRGFFSQVSSAPPDFMELDDDDKPFIEVNVRHTGTQDPFFARCLRDTEGVYAVKHNTRGRAVIINNEIFIGKLKDRDGTGFDMTNLDTLLMQLGYDTVTHSDLTGQQIVDELAKESRHSSHRDADSFILAIFSHGAEGMVYGSDGVAVSIEKCIKRAFNGRGCPALSGKPKLMIIQACQGKGSTVGVPVADSEDEEPENKMLADAMRSLSVGDGDQRDAVPWTPAVGSGDSLHERADMLVAYSTVSGYKSWRLPEKGSWFIRVIVYVFMHYAHKEHLIELLTKVRNEVSKKKTNMTAGDLYVQMPANDDTLRKKWFFYPGYHPE